jgi:FkbM family methyltransferase
MLQNIFLATQFLKIQYLCGILKSSEDEWKLLDKIVIPGSTVVDIGSNIGRYTLKLSSITGSNGIVVAIEPNNHIFKIANSIQQIHKLKNIVQINACVSDKCQIADFFEDWSAPSGVIFSTATRSRLLETFSSSQLVVAERSKEDLKINKKLCITIDSLNIKPSLIKVDVEGAEIEAIKGGLSTISKYKPLLIIEDNQLDFSFLKELGYKIYKLPNSRNKIFSHINDNRNSIIKNLILKF